MVDFLLVHKFHCSKCLLNDFAYIHLVYWTNVILLPVCQQLLKCSIWHVFWNDVEILAVLQYLDHINDVWMLNVTDNWDVSLHCFEEIHLVDLFSVNLFDHQGHIRHPMGALSDFTYGTLSNLFINLISVLDILHLRHDLNFLQAYTFHVTLQFTTSQRLLRMGLLTFLLLMPCNLH